MNSVEQDISAMRQQVNDLAADVKVVPALMESMAEVKVAMQYMQRDQGTVMSSIEKLNLHIEQRESHREQGETSRRWQGYAMAVSLVAVLMAIVAQIILTLATGAG